jgi:acylphosphatase
VQARRYRIEGRVQGVGFRDHCVRHAAALGLAGWVRNRPDGSVEVFAQGSETRLEPLEAWLRRGPPAARVDRIESFAEAPDAGLGSRFEWRPSG